jgi:cytochrome c
MKHEHFLFGIGAAISLTFSSGATAAGDATRGKSLYQTKCAACHSIDYNGVGPAHRGVLDRKAGSRADYTYSPALKASSLKWSAKTLDSWLSNPEKLIPGQKMGFAVPGAKDRADLIAYLQKDAR